MSGFCVCHQQPKSTDGRSPHKRVPREDTVRELILIPTLPSPSFPFPPLLYAFALFHLPPVPPRRRTVPMPRSVSSESTAPSSPSSSRNRLFSRAASLLSPNGKLGPLLDTNPPPVARPSSYQEGRKSFNAIRTKFQAAGTPLKLLRRLSTSNAHLKPHMNNDSTPQLSKVKVKRGRGRSYFPRAGRPPSMTRSHSAPGAPGIGQSRVSPTLIMSDNASHKSTVEPNGTLTVPHDVHVPVDLQTGVTVIKVSAKENKKVTVRIDPDLGQIFYQSRRARISESLLFVTLFTVMDRLAIPLRL